MNKQDDPTAVNRKRDHIDLALKSQIAVACLDRRFSYEPLLAAHPTAGSYPALNFLEKKLHVPMWVSSMTGGTTMARTINHNLARACCDFGMGMGLGSCRALLYSNDFLGDFDVRALMGDDLPLYANLGIAQVEKMLEDKKTHLILDLLEKLRANGLIIHVNPIQEWLQPEGDRIKVPPIQTIIAFLEKHPNISLIIKEVGQGMGYESLKALLQLPLAAIDFAANGGTNFAKIELTRNNLIEQLTYKKLTYLGHDALEMLTQTNNLVETLGEQCRCHQIIISGGVQDFLDGFFLIKKSKLKAIYGQASGFLRHAQGSYEELYAYVQAQVRGLELANAYLKVRL